MIVQSGTLRGRPLKALGRQPWLRPTSDKAREALMDVLRPVVGGARFVDLCCGTGRAGEELVRRGYDTVGADLSEPMVRECASRTPALPAIVSDASWLAIRDESLDLTISVYDSLNYILEPDNLARCFHDVFRALRPGALFVFDVNTPRALSSGLFTQDNMGSQDPLLYSWKANWDPGNHCHATGQDFRVGYEALRPVHLHTHVKDYRPGTNHAIVPGDGDVDWLGQLQALQADGYQGLLVLETHFQPKIAGSRDCVERLRELLAQIGEGAE